MKKYSEIAQGTAEWLQIRKGKITGTALKAIMGTPRARQEAFYEILAERLTVGVEEDYENAMDRGTRLEPEAIAAFELEAGKQVNRVGYCEDEENSQIGYSPDGLISDEEDIEVKCMGGKNHVKMWLSNEVPDEYYWQLVQAFVVNPKLQKRYFVGYNPDIPVHPLHIIEVTRAQVAKDIEVARSEQEKFLAEINSKLQIIIKI